MTDATRALPAIEREWTGAHQLLESASEEAWSRPTRCEGWTVADLVAHACWGISFETDGLRRARAGGDGVAEGQAVDAGEPTAVLAKELAARTRALLAEIGAHDGSARDQPVPMPYGEMPLWLALDVFTMEAGVHASDLKAALGVDDRLEGDVCRATFSFLAAFGPTLARVTGSSALEPGVSVALCGETAAVRFVQQPDGTWTTDTVTGATTRIAGADSDVVLFALGRRALAGLEVTGERRFASRFKQILPGP